MDGVQAARPRIFEKVKLLDLPEQTVLLIGLDVLAELKDDAPDSSPWNVELSDNLAGRYAKASLFGPTPVILGKALDAALDEARGKAHKVLQVKAVNQKSPTKLTLGSVVAHGPASALGGNLLILDLPDAAKVLGLKPGKITRIDVVLRPGANREKVPPDILEKLAGQADVRTPDEQNQSVQNVMASMQVGLLLCGVAALIVGLFLVYNALSVSVAERRHEIGILLAVGATPGQIRRLFAGEAAFLGLVGSLLGIPLGMLFANLALQPMQETVNSIFLPVEARGVVVSWRLCLVALASGIGTAVLAALVPTLAASREKPAAAVRRIPSAPTWNYRLVQAGSSGRCCCWAWCASWCRFLAAARRHVWRPGSGADRGFASHAAVDRWPGLATATAGPAFSGHRGPARGGRT